MIFTQSQNHDGEGQNFKLFRQMSRVAEHIRVFLYDFPFVGKLRPFDGKLNE